MIVTKLNKENLITTETSFGCYKRYCHPKFKPFVVKFLRGRCLINTNLTFKKIEEMMKIMDYIRENNKTILFIGTKRRIKSIVEDIVSKTNYFYTTHRWIGGLLTNFNIAHKKRNLKFQELQKSEHLNFIKTRPKKEQMQFKKELDRLEKSITGVLNMKSIPDYIFLIDPKIEKTALNEAKTLNIPILAITQMNMDPSNLEAFIPANDNSETVIKTILSALLKPSYKEVESKTVNEVETNEIKELINEK